MPIELFEESVRERLADEITGYRPPEVRQLEFDRWVLASLLQKAIRRDELEWALPAAASLLSIDPVRFWRRLLIIAFEDVSFAEVALVTEILAARSKRWRASVATEWIFAAYFVQQLCKGLKCRAPNNLIEIAKYDPAVRAKACILPHTPFDEALGRACAGDLPARVTAAARIYGRSTDFEPHPDADPERVVSALLAEASPALAYTVTEGLAATRLDHPLAMAVLSKAMPTEPYETADDRFPSASLVRGIPAYAYDMHTRAGAAAIRSFVQQARGVRRALKASGVPERGWFELVRHCIFDLETGLAKRRLVDPVSTDLRRHAETVGYGRTSENAARIMEAIVASWPLYAHFRLSLGGGS